jgi:hypothetical protein
LPGLGRYTRHSAALAGVIAAGALGAAPASAAGTTTVNCRGGADGCVAVVKIAGGVSNRTVVVRLSDTDFRMVGRRVVPGSSKGKFSTKNGHFSLGGSEFTFTLNAANSNPGGARIILLFADRLSRAA